MRGRVFRRTLVKTVELFVIKTYLPRAIFIIILWKLSSIMKCGLLGKSYREYKFTLMSAFKFMLHLQGPAPKSRKAAFAETRSV